MIPRLLLRIFSAVLVLAFFIGQSLQSQETKRAGSLDERFKQLDKDGNGALTVEEIGAEWLEKWDGNGDGSATIEEVKAAFAGRATREPSQPTAAEAGKPGDHNFIIQVAGLDRHYTVHVPPSYDGKTPVPVVVMLHGGGGTSQGAATETGWGAKANEARFLAVFPNAMPPDPSKPSSFGRNPQLWNDGSERFYQGQNKVDDVGFLNAMLDELLAKYAVDAQRIFFTGFSNGASMTFRAGAELSQRIAAIAPVAGACWLDPLTVKRPISMCYITGTADPLNRIEGGVPRLGTGASDKVRAKAKPPVRDSIMKWVKAVGCPTSPRTTSESNGVRIETYGPGRDDAEVIYVTVEGLGHTWPGGKSLLPEFMVGKRSDKPKATDFIWEFFQKHPTPQKEEP